MLLNHCCKQLNFMRFLGLPLKHIPNCNSEKNQNNVGSWMDDAKSKHHMNVEIGNEPRYN